MKSSESTPAAQEFSQSLSMIKDYVYGKDVDIKEELLIMKVNSLLEYISIQVDKVKRGEKPDYIPFLDENGRDANKGKDSIETLRGAMIAFLNVFTSKDSRLMGKISNVTSESAEMAGLSKTENEFVHIRDELSRQFNNLQTTITERETNKNTDERINLFVQGWNDQSNMEDNVEKFSYHPKNSIITVPAAQAEKFSKEVEGLSPQSSDNLTAIFKVQNKTLFLNSIDEKENSLRKEIEKLQQSVKTPSRLQFWAQSKSTESFKTFLDGKLAQTPLANQSLKELMALKKEILEYKTKLSVDTKKRSKNLASEKLNSKIDEAFNLTKPKRK